MKKSFKNINFVRFGNLRQTKGKVVSSSDFHKAPESFGLYAFPEFFVEDFLISWKYDVDQKLLKELNKKNPGKNYKTICDWLDDEDDGEKYTYLEKIDLCSKMENHTYKELKNKDRKILKYRGNVWHHFTELSKSSQRNEYWVLDCYADYVKYLEKRVNTLFVNRKYDKNLHGDDFKSVQIGGKVGVLKRLYSLDEFEVYLPDKIK